MIAALQGSVSLEALDPGSDKEFLLGPGGASTVAISRTVSRKVEAGVAKDGDGL